MAKATIHGRGLSPHEVEDLLALLAETGACDGPVDVVDAIDAGTSDLDDAVVLILGTPGTCADNELEANLVHASASTRRAIWVWPKGSTESDAPPAAKKYCYSRVSWSAEKLSAVLADDDVTCFENASGIPVPPVETERNLCVDDDDEAKPK